MLGVLSGDSTGLKLLDRWRMINMMYHIIDLKQRPDLIKLLLSNFDYSQMGHPRVLLSKALTGGSKEIRTHATNVLRRYSGRFRPNGPAGGRLAAWLAMTSSTGRTGRLWCRIWHGEGRLPRVPLG